MRSRGIAIPSRTGAAAALLMCMQARAAMELPPVMVDVLGNGEQCLVGEQQVSCDTVGSYLRDTRVASDHSIAIMLTDMTDQAEASGQRLKAVIERAGYSQVMAGFGLFNAFDSPALPTPLGSGSSTVLPQGNSTFYQVKLKASLFSSTGGRPDHQLLDSSAQQIAASFSGHVIYEGDRYFNMTMPEDQVARLKQDPRVESVNAAGAYKPVSECLTAGCPQVLVLSLDDNGQHLAARVGEKIELSFIAIGPHGYGDPEISSDAVHFTGIKPVGLPTPAGPALSYTFEAVAEGEARIFIPHNVPNGPTRNGVTFNIRVRKG